MSVQYGQNIALKLISINVLWLDMTAIAQHTFYIRTWSKLLWKSSNLHCHSYCRRTFELSLEEIFVFDFSLVITHLIILKLKKMNFHFFQLYFGLKRFFLILFRTGLALTILCLAGNWKWTEIGDRDIYVHSNFYDRAQNTKLYSYRFCYIFLVQCGFKLIDEKDNRCLKVKKKTLILTLFKLGWKNAIDPYFKPTNKE